MSRKPLVTFALLATTAIASLAHADDATRDPGTGKKCVTYLSSETTAGGQTQMNFRNTCGSPFQIRVEGIGRTREKGIEAGTPQTPARVSLICTPEERCEVAKWVYE
ncbi:MAG: hypothetical protein WDO12_12505 [Pseudomonadota bacterium]